MCDPVTIGVAVAATATVAQGYQARQQGRFQDKVAQFNARQQENEATRARNLGVEEENKQRERVQRLLSQQRAQLGAAGVELGTGSALQLQEDTLTLGEADALRIRSNFLERAEQTELQSTLTRAEGRAARRAGESAFRTSLLKAGGTALSGGVADKWFTPASAGAQGLGTTLSGTQANLNVGAIA